MNGPYRRPPAEWLAAASFVVSAGAATTLAVVYWRGGQPQLEGVLLAVALGGLGFGLVVWANRLLPQGPHVEERQPLATADQEREAFEEDVERGGLARRRLLTRTIALAGAALGAAFAFPIRSLGPNPRQQLIRTPWKPNVALVGADGHPVRAADVPVDGLLTVFPDGHPGSADGQAVLVRVPPELFRPRRGRESWAPDGLVAYSKVCTHAGCPVGLYQSESHQLLCPCHQSAFDVLDGAEPVFGPAAWPLPQLPLEIGDDGVLRAGGDFSDPVGPGWWR